MPTRSRVSAGLRFSKVSPVEDSTHSPSMKFLNTLVGWLLPRVAGEASVSVAMIAPYECLDIDATAGREGAARRCSVLQATESWCGPTATEHRGHSMLIEKGFEGMPFATTSSLPAPRFKQAIEGQGGTSKYVETGIP